MEEFSSKASTRDSLGSVDSVTAQTQSELELDRAAHLETMAAVEQTRGRLRQELAGRAEWTRAREARVLAIQQSSKAHGDGLEQSMADARDMLARIDKEERRHDLEQDSEVSVEQQRLEAHTAGLHATHVETRRLQDDLMRKREAFLQGRDALQGALQGLQEERLDMQDWCSPMWKSAAQRKRPIRPPARPASASSSSGRPPASASLGQWAELLWLAGRYRTPIFHTGFTCPQRDSVFRPSRPPGGNFDEDDLGPCLQARTRATGSHRPARHACMARG